MNLHHWKNYEPIAGVTCEGCSRRITVGELVQVIDDGGGERVVVHAGRCPTDARSDG